MAKPKKITLIHPSGAEFEFDADHAERILAMPNAGGGWKRKDEITTKKKGKDGGNRRTAKAKVTGAEAPENDCGCS